MQFHDWVLESIEVEWMSRKVFIHVRGPNKKGAIECKGFSIVTVPREESWGPSESVYCLKQHKDDATSAQAVDIEMQSGDVISVVADEITLPAEE